MEITDVKVYLLTNTFVKALASVTFDDSFAVHDIRLIQDAQKLFILMPRKRNSGGTYTTIVQPTRREFKTKIENAVVEEYRRQTRLAKLKEDEEKKTANE